MAAVSVAVIGAGIQGLAALKNFHEEGFEVTCFEKRECIGGLWQFTDDKNVNSVMKSETCCHGLKLTPLVDPSVPVTVANVSKFQFTYTDYPSLPGSPVFMNGQNLVDYLRSYVDHFALGPHIQFHTTLHKSERNVENMKWRLHFQSQANFWSQEFDKVAICTGSSQNPFIPSIPGLKESQVEALHSKHYKGPDDFTGKTVMVVGLGNSTGDVTCDLVGHAKKVYVSYRHGNTILPRWAYGKPLDQLPTRRTKLYRDIKLSIAPQTIRKSLNAQIQQLSKDSFTMDPSWKMRPTPSYFTHRAMVSDKFVDCLWRSEIKPVGALKCFSGTRQAVLSDGSVLEDLDRVIFCTGFETDYSTLPTELDPFKPVYGSELLSDVLAPRLPRLYKHVFPPEYADNFVVLNAWNAVFASLPLSDLLTMAVAQVWKGTYALPTIDQMDASIAAHANWIREITEEDNQNPIGNADHYSKIANEGPWIRWLNDVAGTGVNEKLGYGLEGWLFWLQSPNWCNMLMDGVDSPHVMRLFDGRRKKWTGAESAIRKSNMELEFAVAERGRMMSEKAK